MTSRTHPFSHYISTTFLGQNVAEIIKYPCHLFSYKTLKEKFAIALSWKQDMMSLAQYIYSILVLTHFHTGHRKPKTLSQFLGREQSIMGFVWVEKKSNKTWIIILGY